MPQINNKFEETIAAGSIPFYIENEILMRSGQRRRKGRQITLRIRYRKSSKESGKDDFIEITVEDTGIIIKEEDIPRLFRPFEQIEAPLTKLYAGVGIELTLACKLIEAHDGATRMESDYGKGTKFIFTMPIKDGHEKCSKDSQT